MLFLKIYKSWGQGRFDAIGELKPYIGSDSLHSNHLKNCSELLFDLMAKFINSCISHSYMPTNSTMGIINPLVKDKMGKLNYVKNYRPIMSS